MNIKNHKKVGRSITDASLSVTVIFSLLFLLGCEETEYEKDLASVPTRAANHGFPKLANNTQVGWAGNEANGFRGRNLFERLHWYDYAVVDGDATTEASVSHYLGRNGIIRSRNPNFVATGYFSPADFTDDVNSVRWRKLARTYAFGHSFDHVTISDPDPTDNFQKDEWLFKDIHGDYVPLYQFSNGIWSYMVNMNKEGARNHYVGSFASTVVTTEKVDGIYNDWVMFTAPDLNRPGRDQIDLDGDGISDVISRSDPNDPVNVEWREGLLALLQLQRQMLPQNFLITGNSGWYTEIVSTQLVTGTMMENFNKAVESNWLRWGDPMYNYASYCKLALGPKLSILQVTIDSPGGLTNQYLYHDLMVENNNVFWTSDELQQMRFGLASSLMFDGYFSATNHGTYHAAWLMDEYFVTPEGNSFFPNDPQDLTYQQYAGWLGQPLGESFNVDNSSETLWDRLQLGWRNGAENSVWRRDFENGIVMVNPTSSSVTISLETPFRKISGHLDPLVNDGAEITSIEIPAEGGILLRR